MKRRDAERSRVAILDAAEALFAERGFDGASLSEVGAAASLSRGAPGYFFGSKERLYVAVLERVFAARQEATARAFAPVHEWCAGAGDLRDALTRATEGYLGFLLARPAFVRLIIWEDLAGGGRLKATPRASTAMLDAFGALRADGRLAPFDVEDAVLLYVSLTFAPLAHASTFMVAFERDLSDAAQRARHVAFVVERMLDYLGA